MSNATTAGFETKTTTLRANHGPDNGNEREVRICLAERDEKYWDRKDKHGGEACDYCGRKTGKNDLWIFLLYGGDPVHRDDVSWVVENVDGVVGFYRVGPSCAKRYPAEYVLRSADVTARF